MEEYWGKKTLLKEIFKSCYHKHMEEVVLIKCVQFLIWTVVLPNKIPQ